MKVGHVNYRSEEYTGDWNETVQGQRRHFPWILQEMNY